MKVEAAHQDNNSETQWRFGLRWEILLEMLEAEWGEGRVKEHVGEASVSGCNDGEDGSGSDGDSGSKGDHGASGSDGDHDVSGSNDGCGVSRGSSEGGGDGED